MFRMSECESKCLSDDEKEKKHFQKVVMNFQNYKSVMNNQIGMGWIDI